MALHEKQIGRNGMKPETCALSGRPLIPGDVTIGVGDALVGVKGPLWSSMTPDEKAKLRKQWAAEINSASVKKSAIPGKGE